MRDITIEKIKKYFKVAELVGDRVANRYGESAWRFLDTDLLLALLFIREEIGRSITVNTAEMQQRGLRTNVSPMVVSKTNANKLYLSAHLLGKAVDFSVEGMTAQEVRDWIVQTTDFTFKIRLEDGVSWVHLDVISEKKNPQVYLFQP